MVSIRFVSSCLCRNNLHSNVLAYREKSCLDVSRRGSDLWYDDYYKDYYRYNTERIHYDVKNYASSIPAIDNDHTIRISVNFGNEIVQNGNDDDITQTNNTEENSSGASISIVEIGETQESDNNNQASEFIDIRTKSKDTKELFKYRNYNEKAIDVPKDFEKRAYENLCKNELSPFVRNLQPSSQVI